MKVDGDYWKDGYAHVRGLIRPEMAREVLKLVRQWMNDTATPPSTGDAVLRRPALQFSNQVFVPLETFLWALTPTVAHLVGKTLLPSYCYFRIYKKGDVCLVHADRDACEVSMSLTLGYSEQLSWPLEIARAPWAETRRNTPSPSARRRMRPCTCDPAMRCCTKV